MKSSVLSRIRCIVGDDWKWMLGFFGPLIALMLLAKAVQTNGRPAHITALQQGVLVQQNPDEGWAIFRDKDGPVLVETHDRTLVVGKTYEVIDHPYPVAKIGYLHAFGLQEKK